MRARPGGEGRVWVTMQLPTPKKRAPRSLAEERYSASVALQSATMGLRGYETLVEMEQDAEALSCYVDAVLRAGSAYGAVAGWIGPIEFMLDDDEADAFERRLVAYRKSLSELRIGG